MDRTNKRLYSAAKFIDFFIHDILDYSLLLNNKKFMKQNKIFDIKEALQEIFEILETKIKTRQVSIRAEFDNFEDDFYIVKTDVKRLQQILLNLISNAIKFSRKNG
jgi:signal transduction histidine kinase